MEELWHSQILTRGLQPENDPIISIRPTGAKLLRDLHAPPADHVLVHLVDPPPASELVAH